MWKRPANGISPKHIDEVIGRIARSNIYEDEVIKWSDLNKGFLRILNFSIKCNNSEDMLENLKCN